MSRILVIDDDIAINKAICKNLGLMGHETLPIYDGKTVVEKLTNSGLFDIALLDVTLPDISGFELLPLLRERGIPAVFLTAQDDIESKLKGLTSGAEDYMVKPFELTELMVRIEKVLSRTGKEDHIVTAQHISINTLAHSVKDNKKEISLTPIEYDLLLFLLRNKNKTLTREKLLTEVWGIFYDGGTRTVDVHIAQIRKKTGLTIVTVPKVGYRLEAER